MAGARAQTGDFRGVPGGRPPGSEQVSPAAALPSQHAACLPAPSGDGILRDSLWGPRMELHQGPLPRGSLCAAFRRRLQMKNAECVLWCQKRRWASSIILSTLHSGQPRFKQNQVGDFPPQNDKQQPSQVRDSLLPAPSLQVNRFRVSPCCPSGPPSIFLEAGKSHQPSSGSRSLSVSPGLYSLAARMERLR